MKVYAKVVVVVVILLAITFLVAGCTLFGIDYLFSCRLHSLWNP